MKCIGCGADLTEQTVAAYAIMSETDNYGAEPDVKGPGAFHAHATCKTCYTDPSHRTRLIKAHFSLPDQRQLYIALGTAGSSGKIG